MKGIETLATRDTVITGLDPVIHAVLSPFGQPYLGQGNGMDAMIKSWHDGGVDGYSTRSG
ncbi:hypothetical protein [Roseibium sp.]|uniref:hypothetical protein n=1 Tax=Roseibium sp. TaxID=1936156 RepID=UPI003B519189